MNEDQKFAEECMARSGLTVKIARWLVYDKSGEILGSRQHVEIDGEVCPLPRGPLKAMDLYVPLNAVTA